MVVPKGLSIAMKLHKEKLNELLEILPYRI